LSVTPAKAGVSSFLAVCHADGDSGLRRNDAM